MKDENIDRHIEQCPLGLVMATSYGILQVKRGDCTRDETKFKQNRASTLHTLDLERILAAKVER